MHLLALWKYENYWRDMEEYGGGYNFNSRQKVLHDCLELGDHLWLVTLARDATPRLVVVARLVVVDKTINLPGSPYGQYCVWGDKRNSKYFLDDGKRDDHALLSGLAYAGKAASGLSHRRMAQAFQTMRRLSDAADRELEAATRLLPLDPRARPFPDEELLEAYATGLSQQLPLGPHPPIRRARWRRRAGQALASKLIGMYGGRCQLCGFDPVTTYGVSVCEVHHVVPLSKGGTHNSENAVLLCPNHHRLVHKADAHFDYGRLGFSFSHLGRYEPLIINKHIRGSDGSGFESSELH
ncbi:MAG: hypothetical protein AMXMBFR61_10580 [Fimbriimonadales bacterium]